MSSRAPLHVPRTVSELAPYVSAGVLDSSDIHFAALIGSHLGTRIKQRSSILLACALAARAPRFGHVCLNLFDIRESVGGDVADPSVLEDLHWPEGELLVKALTRKNMTDHFVQTEAALLLDDDEAFDRPLVLRGNLLYLQRYETYENGVKSELQARSKVPVEPLDQETTDSLFELFPDEGLQRDAATLAVSRRFTVLAGGPGTGKTYTLARILAVLRIQAVQRRHDLSVALAAPTGKAASRMTEAIGTAIKDLPLMPEVHDLLEGDSAVTIHRLLGRVDGVRFRHDRSNRLHHDVIVVDEASMISLPLMARLLDAIRTDTRVILVGDPFQLASVEAGAVFGEITADANRGKSATGVKTSNLSRSIIRLERTHRFEAASGIGLLAEAVKSGNSELAVQLLRDPAVTDLKLVNPSSEENVGTVESMIVENGRSVVEAAEGSDPQRGGNPDTAMLRAAAVKLLCGTRYGPNGVHSWQRRIENGVLGDRTSRGSRGRWYIGRPVMMTRNDYLLSLFNGDTGVVVAKPRPWWASSTKNATSAVLFFEFFS